MSENKLLRGTMILTIGTYISRILGMLYLFPFFYLVGDVGYALYSYGYGQYTIFLAISTVGFPAAVSKFIAKYNSLGDYYTGRRMFKSGLLVMTITGLISFLLLYSLAPVLAPLQLGGEDALDNSVEDIVMVIRMVSFALLVVPIMSMFRGFFQGHQSMGPTAVSQVVEQIVRVAFLLTASFIVIKVLDGERSTAVGFATFAAFVGAIGGLLLLIWYWFKRKPYLDELLANSKPQTEMTTKEMYKEIFSYAGPFVFVGLAVPLFQNVDYYTFNWAMRSIGQAENSESLLGILGAVPKLVMIPVSIATAFSLTLIPTITDLYTSKDFVNLKKQMNKAYQICILLVLPAVVGLAVLAYPAYGAFFEVNAVGGNVLRWYAPVALLFSFYSITSAILQGINKQKFAVISLIFGLLLKIIINIPFIQWFGEIGAILATALGFIICILFNFTVISKYTSYSFSQFIRRTLLMVIFSSVMAITIILTMWVLSFVMVYEDGRIQSVVILLIGVIVGGVTYLFLAYRSHLLEKLLGHRFSFLEKRKKKATE